MSLGQDFAKSLCPLRTFSYREIIRLRSYGKDGETKFIQSEVKHFLP